MPKEPVPTRANLSDEEQEILEHLLAREERHTSTRHGIMPRAPAGDPPMSFAQERLWLLNQLEGESAAYNLAWSVRLVGELDVSALRRSLDALVARHEPLRTTFTTRDGDPVQVIAERCEAEIDFVPLDGASRTEVETQLRTRSREPFDLSHGPLFRAVLFRLGKAEHVLMLLMHHIVSDGWSFGILHRELSYLYTAYRAGGAPTLPALPIQYADFAVWQRERQREGKLAEPLAYWQKQLAGLPELLELPTDRPRPALQTFRGAKYVTTYSGELRDRLRDLGRQTGATLYMVLLSAFTALLHRHTEQDDIAVGTPIAGRHHPELEGLIGFLVNTVVIRTDLGGDPVFSELLDRVRRAALDSHSRQDVPFQQLVETLRPERRLSHSPLFQVMFILQNTPQGRLELPGIEIEPIPVDTGSSMFDLTLSMEERDDGLHAVFEYNTDLFERESIVRLGEHYRRLLAAVVEEPDCPVSRLALMSEHERHRLLVEWNETDAAYPRDRCIHTLFEEQVERTPDVVAAVHEGVELTYDVLNRRANRLAHELAGLGIEPGKPVGLHVERSLDMLVGLMGVLKAGCAYVPLDPSYPEQRLSFMAKDARLAALLTQRSLHGWVAPEATPVIYLDELEGSGDDVDSEHNPALPQDPSSPAYVIYTSGSTGEPKGVAGTHRGAVNRFAWMWKAYPFSAGEVCCQKTALSFVDSVWEIFGPLLQGVPLVILGDDVVKDPKSLIRTLAEKRITRIVLVPSLLAALLDAEEDLDQGLARLRFWVCSGETLPVSLCGRFREALPGAVLLNLYGSSEVAGDATFFDTAELAKGASTVPIGRPISNTRVYVLDERGEVAPVGVAGELHVSGDGVARGYVGRERLTAERFIEHALEPGKRLYRTGDRTRWTGSGVLEYLGRRDEQVKVRGFRVELGEVESVLETHPCVRQSVVTHQDDHLVAYVLLEKDARASVTELRAHLEKKLPEYMVPAAFVEVDSIPLTPNGKVDRQSLVSTEGARVELGRQHVAPRTPLEEKIAAIWREVLGVERVGVYDNFFELGGHSLLATKVVARLQEHVGSELTLLGFFEHPSVAELARELGEPQARVEPLRRREGEGPARLSFAQQRLWFLERFETESTAYHIPMVLRLSGSLEVPVLESALTEVMRRHEALRTVFPDEGGEPVQRVLPAETVKLETVDLSAIPEQAERVAKEEARRPFDLREGPVVRFGLMRLSSEEHWLLATFHHIVADGWSLGVFQEELTALYGALARGEPAGLSELAVQYSDYAEWQRQTLSGEAFAQDLDYWRERLSGAPAALDLPTDRPRPAMQSYRGSTYSAVFPRALVEGLESLARRHDATLFMVLLASLNVLLSRYSGQKDISVGSPIAGRTRTELEKLIGVFINTLVLRTDLSGEPSFEELVGRVRETTLGAFSHQEVPFEKLVEVLQPERDLSHAPLFQVMLVVQNAPLPPNRMAEVEVEREFFDIGKSMFDLTYFVRVGSDGLRVSVEYATDLFEESTVVRMLSHLKTLLESIVASPQRRTWELEMMPPSERHRLLVEWNDTDAEYPRESCVHELIRRQAERMPDRMAVSFGEDSLSYGELEERSNRLARYLEKLCSGVETRVGVYVERSTEMLVALLGALKAGGAYVPLDPSFPRERLAFMMRDADVRVVLSQSSLAKTIPEHEAEVVEVDGDWNRIALESGKAFSSAARADTLAYVLYTSGSTGVPKGVQIEHRALSNFLCSMQREPGLEPWDRLLAVTTLSFDIAGLELFLPLITGAAVHIASREESSDGHRLAELIRSSRATIMQATPATWRMLLDSGWNGEPHLRVLCGGEGLPRALADELLDRCASVWNLYGPTETTIWSTVERLEPSSGPVLVGRPIANTRVYLLDERRAPVPTGVPGELYIGGDGLARGYLARDDLSLERFVPDPFAGGAERMYRTGDLARYHTDGKLEVLGRVDDQVKLRGFRIELGEIESILESHRAVQQAAVTAREYAPSDKRLIGYVVPEGGSRPSLSELRAHLKEKLPDYMVPSSILVLDALPLTPNGKVDRKALPDPDESRPELSRRYATPGDALELQLAEIWQDVLGVDRVGVHDDFFELGGHSLMGVRLFATIEDRLGLRLPLATLFRASSIARLGSLIRESGEARPWSCLVPIQPRGERPPFFCIHAEGGEVLFYRNFARLIGLDQPVYGLQALGLDGKGAPLETIEEMARHYISEIRRIQPEGPYLLGGHCYGGVIMFEMAQQLHRAGETVALMAMMDSSPARIDQTLGHKLRDGWAALLRSPLALLRHIVLDEIAYHFRWSTRERGRNGNDGNPASAAHARVGEALVRAYLSYEPKPYPGHITYFMNSEKARLGHIKWPRLAGSFDLHVFPGTPNTTFQTPSVEVLASKVRACLDGVLATKRGREAVS